MNTGSLYSLIDNLLKNKLIQPTGTEREGSDLLEERTQRLDEQILDARSSMEAVLNMGIDRLFVMEQEFSLALLEAERNWISQFVQAIDKNALTDLNKKILVQQGRGAAVTINLESSCEKTEILSC